MDKSFYEMQTLQVTRVRKSDIREGGWMVEKTPKAQNVLSQC